MRMRNAARRRSRAGIGGGVNVGAVAASRFIPKYAWPPLAHRALQRIGRYSHRVFAAELVRGLRAGGSHDQATLRAMTAAFARSRARYDDNVLLERGRKLVSDNAIATALRELLDEKR